MRIPSVSAANPSSVSSFDQRQQQTSPVAYASTQAASAGTGQQPASNRSDQAQGTYSFDQINLAMLLSSQGATIVPPELQLSPKLPTSQPHSSSITFTGPPGSAPSSGLPTALEQATQIIDDLGSKGMLSLANVESAENGCTTAPAGDLINSNTDADIAADFTQLSGGASTMTLAQLTSAIQRNSSPQNQYPDSYGKIAMPGASTATSTTNGVPNSASAAPSASSKARTAALEYLWQEQRLANASNP